MKNRIRQQGIALAESLAAAVILAMTVAAISSISGRSFSQYRTNRDYQLACQMAETQLINIASVGPTVFLDLGQTNGEIEVPGTDGQKKFLWEVVITDEDLDGLYDIEVKIIYGIKKQVSVSTKLYEQTTTTTQLG